MGAVFNHIRLSITHSGFSDRNFDLRCYKPASAARNDDFGLRNRYTHRQPCSRLAYGRPCLIKIVKITKLIKEYIPMHDLL